MGAKLHKREPEIQEVRMRDLRDGVYEIVRYIHDGDRRKGEIVVVDDTRVVGMSGGQWVTSDPFWDKYPEIRFRRLEPGELIEIT